MIVLGDPDGGRIPLRAVRSVGARACLRPGSGRAARQIAGWRAVVPWDVALAQAVVLRTLRMSTSIP